MKGAWIVSVLIVGLGLGVLIERQLLHSEVDDSAALVSVKQSDNGGEVLYWVAPMDPGYRRDKPGKSPMGMALLPVYADLAGDKPGTVRISPTVINNLGVRVEAARFGVLHRQIETVGLVHYDEALYQQINTRVAGWVERIGVSGRGEPVSKGQVLFELYAPELVSAQREYLAALKLGNTNLVDASRERLLALGVGGSEITRLETTRVVRQRMPVLSSTEGYVVELPIQQGAHVSVHSPVMSIAQLDPIWIIVEILERQAGWLESGQAAEVAFDAFPGQRWRGVVEYVYPELEPDSRTLRARLSFANPELRLRPNMSARVWIEATATEPVVHIPREALIRGSVDRVVLALGAGRFRSVAVVAGIESGDRVAILSGLEANAQVVVSGQFLIDSESNIGSALKRLEPVAGEGPAEAALR